MNDENYITFSEACIWILAIALYFLVIFVLIILLPLGFMYVWWDWIIKPKTGDDIFGCIFFGSIIELPLLSVQLTVIYPQIYSYIIGVMS